MGSLPSSRSCVTCRATYERSEGTEYCSIRCNRKARRQRRTQKRLDTSKTARLSIRALVPARSIPIPSRPQHSQSHPPRSVPPVDDTSCLLCARTAARNRACCSIRCRNRIRKMKKQRRKVALSTVYPSLWLSDADLPSRRSQACLCEQHLMPCSRNIDIGVSSRTFITWATRYINSSFSSSDLGSEAHNDC